MINKNPNYHKMYRKASQNCAKQIRKNTDLIFKIRETKKDLKKEVRENDNILGFSKESEWEMIIFDFEELIDKLFKKLLKNKAGKELSGEEE